MCIGMLFLDLQRPHSDFNPLGDVWLRTGPIHGLSADGNMCLQRIRKKNGSHHHFGFSKILNFNGRFAVSVRGQYASVCQNSSKSVKQLQRYGDLMFFFQNSGRPPSWISWSCIDPTHNDYLVVSIILQNLVGINTVVSII